MIKQSITWEVPQGSEKEIVADIISICLNHEDWDDDKIMLITLSIDKWYRTLPLELKRIVDSRTIDRYNILIQEVEGLPI